MEIGNFIENFIAQFDDEPSNLLPESNFRDIEEWSSLVALSVIAMADEEYSVKLTGEDIRNCITVEDLFLKVQSKISDSK